MNIFDVAVKKTLGVNVIPFESIRSFLCLDLLLNKKQAGLPACRACYQIHQQLHVRYRIRHPYRKRDFTIKPAPIAMQQINADRFYIIETNLYYEKVIPFSLKVHRYPVAIQSHTQCGTDHPPSFNVTLLLAGLLFLL
jgi:hypothetical protein